MKLLLDECLPRKLKDDLKGHGVFTVPEMGWAGSKNGELLSLAESNFDVFVTIDQNLTYQQNLQSKKIGIIVLVCSNSRLETIRPLMNKVQAAIKNIQSGDIISIS